MDFVRLGERYTTSYIPDKLIEGYTSLIWTERFHEPGEFELKSFDILGMKALLPEDTLVSHLETREVMVVETHEIQMVGEGADAQPEIVIKGRSASVIFEHRWVESTYQKKRRMRRKYSATAAVGVLLVNAVDNPSGFDITRGDDDPDTELVVNSYPWTTKDVIPNVAVTDSVANDGDTRWWYLEEGMLYPQIMKILIDRDLSLRCMRPVSPNPATVITVFSQLARRGEVARTAVANVTQLRFDLYSGVDRSDSVKFSLLQGHLEKPQYVKSSRFHKTVMEIMSGEVTVSDVYRPGESNLTGWQRKTSGFDAGTPELPPMPEKPDDIKSNATAAQRNAYNNAMDNWVDKYARWKNKRNAIVTDFREEQTKAALRELKLLRRINMFSGDVTALAPYKYQTHYNLGDAVMLFGDYGESQKMIVSEFVRTEDSTGDRGFPGLVEP